MAGCKFLRLATVCILLTSLIYSALAATFGETSLQIHTNRASASNYVNSQYPVSSGYQYGNATSLISCRPSLVSGVTGFCTTTYYLDQCANLEVSSSADCNILPNSVCCYNDPLDTTATPQQLSTTAPTTTPASTSPVPISIFEDSMTVTVLQQSCGILNGNQNLFSSLELAPTNRSSRQRPARLKSVFKGLPGQHNSRFIVQETIVGGFDAPNGTGSVCWQVAILRTPSDGSTSFCGGAIIGSRTILTAGHCMVDDTVANFNSSAYLTVVQIGAISVHPVGPPWYADTVSGCARSYNVARAIPHPNFTLSTLDNDITILILSEAIDFRLHRACACKACLNLQAPSVGDICITSGWGDEADLSSGTVSAPRDPIPLKYVQQAILASSYDRCFFATTANNQVTDLDLFLCGGGVIGQDSCQGDSGGPLVCYNRTTNTQYLAGIVSSGRGCATGLGGLYTKVSAYSKWIFETAPLGDVSFMV